MAATPSKKLKSQHIPSSPGASDMDELIISLDESDEEVAASSGGKNVRNAEQGPSAANSDSEEDTSSDDDDDDDSETTEEEEEITIIEISDTEMNKSDFEDVHIKSEPEDDYEEPEEHDDDSDDDFDPSDLGIVVSQTELPDDLIGEPVNGIHRYIATLLAL
jgi:hypothetical protein